MVIVDRMLMKFGNEQQREK